MNQLSKIEFHVEQSTAAALSDPQRREAVARLIDRLVRPGNDNPLTALLTRAAADESAQGLPQPQSGAALLAHPPTTVPPNTSQHVRLTRENTHQAVQIPHGFELPGTEAVISQEGDRLIIEPIRKRGLAALLDSWDDLDEDFPEIDDPPPAPEDIF